LDDQEMQQLKEAYEYIRETIHTSEK